MSGRPKKYGSLKELDKKIYELEKKKLKMKINRLNEPHEGRILITDEEKKIGKRIDVLRRIRPGYVEHEDL